MTVDSEEKKVEESAESREAKSLDGLNDDGIKWRAKYKLTKSELEESKLTAEKEKTQLIEKVTSTQTEKKTLESRLIQAELKAQAIAAGIRDLELVKLIDLNEVKLNDSGSIEGLEKAVSDFKARKPDFFGSEKKTHSSTNANANMGTENKVAQKDARTMSDEEWKKNKAQYMAGRF